jgi:hypothetical protein
MRKAGSTAQHKQGVGVGGRRLRCIHLAHFFCIFCASVLPHKPNLFARAIFFGAGLGLVWRVRAAFKHRITKTRMASGGSPPAKKAKSSTSNAQSFTFEVNSALCCSMGTAMGPNTVTYTLYATPPLPDPSTSSSRGEHCTCLS